MDQTGRIIIVDDEPTLLTAIHDTLQDQGYEAVGYSSGKKALEGIRENEYDLLITDLMMPEMDGITLLQEALKVDKNLVGIIMTGQATVDRAVEAMKTGAIDFILKPFKLRTILPVLSRAMAIRRLRIENEELTRNLLKRTEELETINKDLEAFSSSVSHDLRAPLGFVKNFAKTIKDQPESSTGAQKLLTGIIDNVEYMEELIDNLLDFARAGRSKLDKTRVNMKEIACRVIDQLHIENQQATLNVGELPSAYGDEKLLTQVFINLISNGIKYSSKKANPEINIRYRETPEELIFWVQDNGNGFDKAGNGKLFEPFQRLHSDTEFQGTGIGLAIVKRIITKHDGNVWAEGVKGEGATFYFSLPKAKA